ncbi:MAG: hypothetical protein QOE56_2286 [Solirubrobacterales bacterium]|nr:hypothetical protein [Solirubrobacterales bacterium]
MGRKRGVSALLALALSGLVVGAAGCGEGDSVSAGATVHVYVVGLMCADAQRELAAEGGRGGDVRVRAVCLPVPEDAKGLNLATAGANARRATEDSTTVSYLEAPGPANAFARPIIEEAGIDYFNVASGANAIRRILKAIEEAGSGSLRDQVRENLEGE